MSLVKNIKKCKFIYALNFEKIGKSYLNRNLELC